MKNILTFEELMLEGLTDKQKKMPKFIQAKILAKQERLAKEKGDKKEDKKEDKEDKKEKKDKK